VSKKWSRTCIRVITDATKVSIHVSKYTLLSDSCRQHGPDVAGNRTPTGKPADVFPTPDESIDLSWNVFVSLAYLRLRSHSFLPVSPVL
jgi:hypothetical protein